MIAVAGVGCAPGSGWTPSRDAEPDAGAGRDAAPHSGDDPSAPTADTGSRSMPDGGETGSELRACDEIIAVIRDFRGYDLGGHPDFENVNEDEPDWMNP